MYNDLQECSGEHWPWEWKTAGDFEAACQRCEIPVADPPHHLWQRAQRVLEHDMRAKDGSRGLALRVAIPEFDLMAGDGLEPTPSQCDVAKKSTHRGSLLEEEE